MFLWIRKALDDVSLIDKCDDSLISSCRTEDELLEREKKLQKIKTFQLTKSR